MAAMITTVGKAVGGVRAAVTGKAKRDALPTVMWRWRYDRAMRLAGFDAAFLSTLTDDQRRMVTPAAWAKPGGPPAWVNEAAEA